MTRPAGQSMDAGSVLERSVMACEFVPGCRVVVAVSGGPDSVALLLAVTRVNTQTRAEWAVLAVHVNHQLRGEEAQLDQTFVEQLSRDLDVPCRTISVDTRAHSAQHRVSLETGARALRYDALERIRHSWAGDVILTAHTANDQAETMIMRLLRGTGLSGLGGIPPRRGAIVRPFLSIRHEEIVRALQAWGVGYRLDSSNRDERHWRNRIRRVVMPALEQEVPTLVPTLVRAAASLRTDADYLCGETKAAVAALDIRRMDGGFSGSVTVWRALHPALQNSVLRRLAADYFDAADLGSDTIDRIGTTLQRPSQSLDLPSGLRLLTTVDTFRLTRSQPGGHTALVPGTLEVPGELEIGLGVLQAERILPDPDEFRRLVTVCGAYHALCTSESLGTSLRVRTRVAGDRVRPVGAPGSRKLQDVMVDRRVPASDRNLVPVVENHVHIVWVPGLVLDERAAARQGEQGLILLSFRPLTHELA